MTKQLDLSNITCPYCGTLLVITQEAKPIAAADNGTKTKADLLLPFTCQAPQCKQTGTIPIVLSAVPGLPSTNS